MTAEQLEAARAERLRQNGHGAITIEDVRTWIEETGLCIFLPRSAQAGFTAPTFVEAVAGQRTTEPTLELIGTAEALLVRLEAEGVAVRLNLSGQPGDQPDYVVAGWVLPYIYALRGDRDWRRSPQLTGSRQVSQLAVHAAKQIDTRNMNATEIRDALGREVTETAVLRALHELWKQLRIIPVVPEVGTPALWQPLRQRFQKAIAEGASTTQVTAISVLASIYLQAVIAASMEDVELFLSPLTSRSKIREVVRGLAATRQVHSTQLGHSPMFYVAGTLPEFPALPNFQISTTYSYRNASYRGSSYLGTDPDQFHDDEGGESLPSVAAQPISVSVETRVVETRVMKAVESVAASADALKTDDFPSGNFPNGDFPSIDEDGELTAVPLVSLRDSAPAQAAKPASAPRTRPTRSAPARPGSARSGARDSRDSSDRRRAPAPRGAGSNGSGARGGSGSRGAGSGARTNGLSKSNGNGVHANGNGSYAAKSSHSNGAKPNGMKANGASGTSRTKATSEIKRTSRASSHGAQNGAASKPARSGWSAKPAGNGHSGNGHGNGAKSAGGSSSKGGPSARPAAAKSGFAKSGYAKSGSTTASRTGSRTGSRTESRPESRTASSVGSRTAKPAAKGAGVRTTSEARPSARPATAKQAAERESAKASASKRYSFSGSAKQAPKPAANRTATVAARSNSRPVAKSTAKPGAPASRTGSTKRRG